MWTLNCGVCDLVTRPGIEPMPLAVKTWSPNHWTARECLSCSHFRFLIATYALFCLSWNEGISWWPPGENKMLWWACSSLAAVLPRYLESHPKSPWRVRAGLMLNRCACLCSIASGVQDSRIIFFSSVRLPLPCSWMIGWPSGWGGDGSTQLPIDQNPLWAWSGGCFYEWGLSSGGGKLGR